MPMSLGCASGLAITVGLAGYGGWRLKNFISRIKEYRDKAKEGAVPAPAALSIHGCKSLCAQRLSWFVIDDQVMGGRSSSALAMVDGRIEFAGTINTKGGGFSSCRTLGDKETLGFLVDATAIEIKATPDARMYKLNLMTGDSWSMGLPSWSHDFHGEAGITQTWVLPLAAFVPTIRGKKVNGAVLNPAAITGVGIALSLYDMQGEANKFFGDGPFKISIEALKVV